MPKIKKEEQELDLQTSAKPKKETRASRWFNDNVTNNKEEMKIICQLTARSAYEQFSLSVMKNVETYAVIFYATFMTILDYIRSKEKTYNNFTIEICNSINIGYTNNDNEENEKVGNFMPIMEYIGINRSIISDSTDINDPNQTTRSYLRWKELNTKKNSEALYTIQTNAYEMLKKEFAIDTRSQEAIIPLFCTFMDLICNVIKMKYKEAEGTDVSEVSMNVMNLFDIFYSFNAEENVEIIEFTPNIAMKLALKDDSNACRD